MCQILHFPLKSAANYSPKTDFRQIEQTQDGIKRVIASVNEQVFELGKTDAVNFPKLGDNHPFGPNKNSGEISMDDFEIFVSFCMNEEKFKTSLGFLTGNNNPIIALLLEIFEEYYSYMEAQETEKRHKVANQTRKTEKILYAEPIRAFTIIDLANKRKFDLLFRYISNILLIY